MYMHFSQGGNYNTVGKFLDLSSIPPHLNC